MELDREQLAWAGGFYSGEGSTHVHTNGNGHRRKYIRTIITNTSLEALERFYRSIGNLGHLSKKHEWKKNPKHKPFYHWRAASFEQAQAVIAMLWPFLSREKQKQARKVLVTVKEDHRHKLPQCRNAEGRFSDCNGF